MDSKKQAIERSIFEGSEGVQIAKNIISSILSEVRKNIEKKASDYLKDKEKQIRKESLGFELNERLESFKKETSEYYRAKESVFAKNLIHARKLYPKEKDVEQRDNLLLMQLARYYVEQDYWKIETELRQDINQFLISEHLFFKWKKEGKTDEKNNNLWTAPVAALFLYFLISSGEKEGPKTSRPRLRELKDEFGFARISENSLASKISAVYKDDNKDNPISESNLKKVIWKLSEFPASKVLAENALYELQSNQ